MSTVPASLYGADLDEHDLVHGIVLPNLPEVVPDNETKKREFTAAQARALDLAALPVRMNHNDELGDVGMTIAYRVLEAARGSGARPRAETLHKLNREPDAPADDHMSDMAAMQRNLLMIGEHRGLSLGHRYHTEYVADCGRYAASASGRPGRIIHKTPYEISTCTRGKRDGSEILEYLPCPRSLHRSTDTAVRAFAHTYRYTEPPRELHKQHANWPDYLGALWSEVRERRRRIVSEDGYAAALSQRGIVAASADNQAALDRAAQQPAPWRVPQRCGAYKDLKCAPGVLTATRTDSEPTMSASANSAAKADQSNAKETMSADKMATDPPPAASEQSAKDVVPNASAQPAAAGGEAAAAKRIDPHEAQEQTFAAFKVEHAKRLELEARLKKLQEAEAERTAEEQKKRKRKEEEEKKAAAEAAEAERNKRKAAIEAAFEKLEANAGDALDSAALAEQKRDLIEMNQTAVNAAEFNRIGNLLGIAVRASEGAAVRREDQRQQELQRQLAEVNAAFSAPPPSNVAASGGIMQPHKRSRTQELTQPAAADAGVERASAFSIFGGPKTPAGAQSTQDLVPAGQQQAAKATPAHTPVNLDADDWAQQVFDDHLRKTGQVPSLGAILAGGGTIQTRVVMSANGPHEQQYVVPRLQQPRASREFSMKTFAPDLFKQVVDGVRAHFGVGGKRLEPGVLREMAERGALDQSGRPKHFLPFNGPLPQDGFRTLGFSGAF